MNANIILRVQDVSDPCEYCPMHGRTASNNDLWHANAELIVGRDAQWRLCAACARLPPFKRFRVRKEIK